MANAIEGLFITAMLLRAHQLGAGLIGDRLDMGDLNLLVDARMARIVGGFFRHGATSRADTERCPRPGRIVVADIPGVVRPI